MISPPRTTWLDYALSRAVSLRHGSLGQTFVATAMIQALNVLTGILLARGLGPHGRGELAAILLWTILVGSLGSLGLPEAVTYESALGGPSAGRALGAATTMWCCLSITLVIVAAGVLTIVLQGYDGATQLTGYLLLATIPPYIATNLCAAALQGLGRFGAFNVVRVLVPAVTAAGLLLLTAMQMLTVRTAAFAYIATYLTSAVVGVVSLRKIGGWRHKGDRDTLRRLLRYGIRSNSTLLTSTVMERLDQLLISLFLGATSLGLYAVATTLTSATTLVASTVGLVAFPRLAALTDTAQRLQAARRFAMMALLGSLVVTAPILVTAPDLLSLFFGAAYARVATVCRVLLIAGVLLAWGQILVSLLRGLGRPLDAGAAGAVGAAATVVLLAVMLPSLGLMGAAFASLIAYAITGWWMLRRVSRALAVTPRQFLAGSVSFADDML